MGSYRSTLGRWRMHNLLAGLLLALVALLSACSSTSGLGKDVVTDSDESDVRRRARIRLELAVGYFQQSKFPIALDEVKKSLIIDPTFVDAYNLRGLIYMQMQENRLAEENFRQALSLAPGTGNILHNYGWMLCQQSRYSEAAAQFSAAIANPAYGDRAKTWMVQGLCQARAGELDAAERSLSKSYELDAANPVTGYNLAALLYRRHALPSAQFYIRRINNSEHANAESLWLGIKVERKLGNQQAVEQLALQLNKRYPTSREKEFYDRGRFNE